MKHPRLISPEEFKGRRVALGLTQVDLAGVLGISRSQVSMIENKERETRKWMDLAFRMLEHQQLMGEQNQK